MNYLSLLLIAFAALNLNACVTSPPRVCYQYEFELNKPIKSSNLSYSNDKFDVKFDIKRDRINFKILNKSDDLIKIVWDESAMLIGGKTERITHSGVKYIDRNNSQPPSVVAPRTSFDDFIIATSRIWLGQSYYNNSTHTEWQIDDILIGCTLKEIAASKDIAMNQSVGILLTTEIQGQKTSETYNFTVKDVVLSELNFTPLTWYPVGSNLP